MQVLLLATGETDKLPPLTRMVISPMLPVLNRPVMSYAVGLLARQGLKEHLVSLYHRPESIEAYFGVGRRWGVQLEYLLQRDSWGTAGAVKWAGQLLKETFLVLPADSMIDLDVAAAMASHQSRRAIATVVVHPATNDHPEMLCVDDEGNVSQTGSTRWCNTGVYIFETAVLEFIPHQTCFDLHSQLLPALLTAGFPVNAYPIQTYWNPLNSFAAYHAAQQDLLQNARQDQKNLADTANHYHLHLQELQFSDGIWVGKNNVIHPSARFSPPVYIGSNCWIGRDVELGPEVVIGANVIIEDEATIYRSSISNNTYVGQLVNLQNRVVHKNLMIDMETGEHVRVADDFLLGEVAPTRVGLNLRQVRDRFLAALLLFLLSPLMLLIALLLLLTQRQVFQHILYATSPPAPQHPTFKLYRFYVQKGNGRSTPLGHWLEKWQLHRLPELWNVCRGDLSLVGVKPLLPDETARITEEWQHKHNEYMAGFTGLWYLNTKPNSELNEVLVTDAYYVATRNSYEDWRILWQTPTAWFQHLRGKNTA